MLLVNVPENLICNSVQKLFSFRINLYLAKTAIKSRELNSFIQTHIVQQLKMEHSFAGIKLVGALYFLPPWFKH